MEFLFDDTQLPVGQRKCGTCLEIKPVNEFYKDGKTASGEPRYRRDCKMCYKKGRAANKALKTRRK